jgi:hypothetical protein
VARPPRTRLTEAALGLAPRRTTPLPEGGSPQAQGAEGDPVEYTMELILMSAAVTSTLFLLQFMDFVRQEHARELASRIRAIPRLLADRDTLTATLPVVTAYGR